MGTIKVTPSDATCGAVVEGASLNSLTNASWSAILQAFVSYGVLVFHEQDLTEEQHVAFAERFGPLDRYDERTPFLDQTTKGPGKPIISVMSNLDNKGTHLTDSAHPQMKRMAGNGAWHADSSFKPKGAKASVLAGIEVPSNGGETEFADMQAAFDALDEEQQARLDTLEAWHSIVYSRAISGGIAQEAPMDPTEAPGAKHALVRRHPDTGKRSLCLGSHACYVYGMGVSDGQSMLRELLIHACQPPRVYVHRWRQGDVVVWDNRRVLHRARPWDLNERRVMRHVRTTN